MTDTKTKLKKCLQGQRKLHHPQLVDALLQTKDAFTDTWPWRKLASHTLDHTLPIATFRSDATRFFCGEQIAARYLSSGTTATQRAVSLFSTEGLLLYKMAVVTTFASVLNRYWGKSAQAAQGVSLIDYGAEDSSLATMLRWLAEFWPLPCLPFAALPEHLANLDPQQPFFLWTTRSQLLQMLRKEQRFNLPPHAIVIETGGWKNLRSNMSEGRFHRRVLDFFKLSEDNLCSEYGMCELAAQAWRCGLRSRFAFPVWVQTLVSRDGMRTERRGTGRLCIYDPLRIDYPWLLCTEDLVSSAGQGLLRLRGRVPHAPLRGCSLDQRLELESGKELAKLESGKELAKLESGKELAKLENGKELAELESGKELAELGSGKELAELLNPSQTSKPQSTRSHRTMESSTKNDRQLFVQACKKFISSRGSVATLGMELGSEHVARDALRSLLAGFPDDWDAALARSYSQQRLRNWLFVLPSNHSLTGIYPLIFAVLLRLRVLVKLPPDLDYLHHFITFLNTRMGAGIDVITIGHADLHIPSDIDALLCYGSDKTLENLRASTKLPLVGFGTHDTVTVTSLDHLLQFPQPHIRDAFHLSQRGCLSSKVLFLVPQPEQKFNATHVKILEENFRVFYGAKLTPTCRTQAEAERLRYMRDLGAVFCSTACPAFPILPIDNLDFDAALPRAAFVLPIVIVRDITKLKNLLRRQHSIKTIVQQGSPAQRQYRNGCCFVRAGQAGQLAWNGTHEGQPLFAARTEIAARVVTPALVQHAAPPS